MFAQAATSLPHNLERFYKFFKTHNVSVMCFERTENLFLNTKRFHKPKAFYVARFEKCNVFTLHLLNAKAFTLLSAAQGGGQWGKTVGTG